MERSLRDLCHGGEEGLYERTADGRWVRVPRRSSQHRPVPLPTQPTFWERMATVLREYLCCCR